MDGSEDKVRRALLAYGVKNYPMSVNITNHTLCSGTEWRDLFERQGDQGGRIVSILEEDSLDTVIDGFADLHSPYYPLIKNEKYLVFSRDYKIRLHAQGVVVLMAKTKASADFIIFHRGCDFPKNMVDMQHWNGFWVWSDGKVSVFYTMSTEYNLTLDMEIQDNGYQIIAWLNRRPAKISVDTGVLEDIGFIEKDTNKGKWVYPVIETPEKAKTKFINITKQIIE